MESFNINLSSFKEMIKDIIDLGWIIQTTHKGDIVTNFKERKKDILTSLRGQNGL